MVSVVNHDKWFVQAFRLEEMSLVNQLAMKVVIPSAIAFAAMAISFTVPMGWIGVAAFQILIPAYVFGSLGPSQDQDDAQIRSTAWKTTVLFFIRQGLSYGLGLFLLSQALAVPLGVYMGSFSVASLADSLVKSMGFLALGVSRLQGAFKWEEPEELFARVYGNLKFHVFEGPRRAASHLSSTIWDTWKSLVSDVESFHETFCKLDKISPEKSAQFFKEVESFLSDSDWLPFLEEFEGQPILDTLKEKLSTDRGEALEDTIKRLLTPPADANQGIDEDDLEWAQDLAPLFHLYATGWVVGDSKNFLTAFNVFNADYGAPPTSEQFKSFILKQGIKTNKDFKDQVLKGLKEKPDEKEIYNHVLSFFKEKMKSSQKVDNIEQPSSPFWNYLYLGCVFLLTLYKVVCNPAILGYIIIGFISLGCIGDVRSPWNGVTLSSLFEEDSISGENIFTFIALEAFRALIDSNPELPFGALSAISAGSYLFDQVHQFVS